MAKIMLVEDDNNLREIYEARLLAEGYEIVSAKDGEEALALAVKEKPDLIISDIMMPKISGFDMLDILRSTPETKNTKVVMMTALSQVEDKNRAEKLGADRYLVKSQVTLEDVARVAREVLEGTSSGGGSTPSATDTTSSASPATPTPSAPSPPASSTSASTTTEPPAAPTSASPSPIATPVPAPPADLPAQSANPAAASSSNLAEPVAKEEQEVDAQIKAFADAPSPEPTPVVPSANTPSAPPVPPVAPAMATEPAPVAKQITVSDAPSENLVTPVTTITPSEPKPGEQQLTTKELLDSGPTAGGPDHIQAAGDDVPVAHKKVIQPLGDPTKKPDIDALLAKEEAKNTLATPVVDSVVVQGGQLAQSPNAPESDAHETPASGTMIKPTDPNAVAL